MFTGLLGLLVFVADIWAILTILKSGVALGAKVLWCLLVLVLPVLGLLIWYFAGPKN
jgi:hypothetical protein